MTSKLTLFTGCLLTLLHGAGHANSLGPDGEINIAFFDPEEEASVSEPPLHMVIYQEDDQTTEIDQEIGLNESSSDGFSAEIYLQGGYRHDDINWNKAHPSGTPNILSELTWNDLEIAVFDVGAKITISDDWVVEGKAGFGAIVDGKNQDSDYFGDDRTVEFSRSNNNSDSGTILDLSMGLGYQFDIGNTPWLQITPKLGFSYHAQNLDITDGYQTIPAYGPFPGLDSSYDTSWYGPWAGLETRFIFSDRLDLSTAIQYHAIKYEATADWNLRGDLQHPESFEHKAYGDGVVASAKTRYAITPEWRLSLSADYQSWTADNDGEDHMFFSDGSEATMRLNEVNWDSYGFNLGIEYRF